MDEPNGRNIYLGLALLCALIGAAAFQGSRGLYESTEGRYAECAREMIVSGDYLRPTLDFAPHWTKPPMTYWAVAAGVRVLGRNAWGARAFLVPTFFFTVFGVFWLGRWLWDRRTGSLAALVYATLWGPVGAAFTVNADSILTLWETLALACFWWGVRRRRKLAVGLMWLFFGMAFFTKGPPALLPLLAVGIFRGLVRDRAVRSAPFWVPAGIGLFLTVGLWWYVLSILRYPGLFAYWLKHEVVGRVATEEFQRHPHWYEMFTVYWPFLAGGSLPWLALVVWGHRQGLSARLRAYGSFNPREAFSFIKTKLKTLSPVGLFLLLAFGCPLTVFSLSRSKLPLYVLPLFPIISSCLASHLAALSTKGVITWRNIATLAFFSTAVVVAAKGVMAYCPSKRDMGHLYRAINAAGPQRHEGGTPLYLVVHAPYYGLQFYWGDPFIRVHPHADEIAPAGFRPLSAVWENMSLEPSSRSAGRLVVTRRENAPSLEKVLRPRGHEVAIKHLTPHWSLLVVSPPFQETGGG